MLVLVIVLVMAMVLRLVVVNVCGVDVDDVVVCDDGGVVWVVGD